MINKTNWVSLFVQGTGYFAKTMIMSRLTFVLVLVSLARFSSALQCEIVGSRSKSTDGNEVGLIFVPGNLIPGERYTPMVNAILASYPGNAWGAVTKGWDGEVPSLDAMEEAIQSCIDQVCMKLITYDACDNFDHIAPLYRLMLQSIRLLTSSSVVTGKVELWFCNMLMTILIFFKELCSTGPGSMTTCMASTKRLEKASYESKCYHFFLISYSNSYDTPFLSVIGSLDGGGIPYAEREFYQTLGGVLEGSARNVSYNLVLEDVNYAQVRLEESIAMRQI